MFMPGGGAHVLDVPGNLLWRRGARGPRLVASCMWICSLSFVTAFSAISGELRDCFVWVVFSDIAVVTLLSTTFLLTCGGFKLDVEKFRMPICLNVSVVTNPGRV